MSKSARGGVSRIFATTALSAVMVAALAPSATAAELPTTELEAPRATYEGPGDGYDGVIEGRAAGSNLLKLDDTLFTTFCLEYGVPAAKSGAFNPVSWAESGIDNLDRVQAILKDSADIGTPLADADAEAAAIQLAIWSHTDDLDFTSVPNAEIVDRATELAGHGGAGTEPLHLPHQIKVSAVTAEDEVAGEPAYRVSIKATDANDKPLSNGTVGLSFFEDDKYFPVPLDENGEYSETIEKSHLEDADTVYLAADAMVSTGTVLAPENPGEQIVMAKVNGGMVGAWGEPVSFALEPTPVPDPEPSADPDPATDPDPVADPDPVTDDKDPADEKPEKLPYTGALGTGWTVLALALVAGGAGYGAWRLRRPASN